MYCSKCVKTKNYKLVPENALLFTCPCGFKWCSFICCDTDEHSLICDASIHNRVRKLFSLLDNGYTYSNNTVIRTLMLRKNKHEHGQMFELYPESQVICLACGLKRANYRVQTKIQIHNRTYHIRVCWYCHNRKMCPKTFMLTEKCVEQQKIINE